MFFYCLISGLQLLLRLSFIFLFDFLKSLPFIEHKYDFLGLKEVNYFIVCG